jgi:O-antigen/teichoic acid export membrane protein
MYRLYLTFMLLGCAFLILMVRPLAYFLFRKEFYEAWRFVPPLVISVVFGAMTGFLGSICLAFKDSKSMGAATGIGAAVNVVLNLLLIPGYSAMGAALATAVSYFIMYVMSFIFVRRYVRLKTDMVRDLSAVALLIAEAAVMVKGAGDIRTYAFCAAVCLILVMIYFKWIKEIAGTVLSRLKGRGVLGGKG